VPVPAEITATGVILKQSTVDYIGLLKEGRYIAFDAKESKLTTRFPLSNIEAHQAEFIKHVSRLGGLGFILIHMYELYPDELIILYSDKLQFYLNSNNASIPLVELETLPRYKKEDTI